MKMIEYTMDKPYLLSIIVTVYNQEEFIDSCLNSILLNADINSSIEIIVVNDGSTDSSEAIVRSYINRCNNLKIISHKTCQGVSVARNTGISNAKGKYILLLDGDDLLISDNLEKFLDFIYLYQDIDIILYGVVFLDMNQLPVRYSDSPAEMYGEGYEILNNWVRSGFYSAIRNKIVLRDYLIKNTLFFMPGIIYEDVPWTAMLFAYNPTVVYADIYIYANRIHESSTTQTADRQKRIFSLCKIYENMEKFVNDHKNLNPLYIKAFKHILSGVFFQLLYNVKQVLPILQKEEKKKYLDYLECKKGIIRYSYKFNRKYIYYFFAKLFGINILIKLKK